MNFFVILFVLVMLGSCGPLVTPSTPLQKPLPPTLNDASKNLLTHQHNNFDRIFNELRTEQRKTSHWIWWVFPTEAPGNSEPAPKSSISLAQVDDVLLHADLKKWTAIISLMATLLENNPVPGAPSTPNDAIIPQIDHGRIHHALKFWLQKAGSKTKKHNDFYQALKRLDKFSWR